ncbi:rCG56457 [Rattus norvegicus]|uniref:RCG56457 n=1 Tax=Rattus norvegicus TaxID=10116 RepID=A6IBE7_RAT|nr:rCG56457 [Rattus norvegicus]
MDPFTSDSCHPCLELHIAIPSLPQQAEISPELYTSMFPPDTDKGFRESKPALTSRMHLIYFFSPWR